LEKGKRYEIPLAINDINEMEHYLNLVGQFFGTAGGAVLLYGRPPVNCAE
jgi:hypothetical protein